MGMCAKLRWNRRQLGLSQKEFAEKAGVCQATISRLERDETQWSVMQPETVDRIYAMFEGVDVWDTSKFQSVRAINSDEDPVVDETVAIKPEPVVVKEEPIVVIEEPESTLSAKDLADLELLEFVFKRVRRSGNHEEFIDNIKLMRKIAKSLL